MAPAAVALKRHNLAPMVLVCVSEQLIWQRQLHRLLPIKQIQNFYKSKLLVDLDFFCQMENQRFNSIFFFFAATVQVTVVVQWLTVNRLYQLVYLRPVHYLVEHQYHQLAQQMHRAHQKMAK